MQASPRRRIWPRDIQATDATRHKTSGNRPLFHYPAAKMTPATAGSIRHRARQIARDTWQSRANLSFFLSLLVILVFVLPLTSLVEEHFNLYIDIAYTVMLISGIAIGWGRTKLFYAGVIVGVIGVAVRWLSWWHPQLLLFREPTGLVAIVLMIAILLVKVFQKGPVSVARIQGAIAAYLLLGLSWANAYAILSRHHPGAFSSAIASPSTTTAWTYFSFMTLTTVGYGDIVPASPVARMLAMGEAVSGQLYLAVLLARLVALQVSNTSASADNHV